MMKKVLVVLVVLALASFGSMAFAADVTVGGSIDIRSRDFRDLDMNKNASDGQVDTQERVRLDVNVKAGDVKGKVTIENDWDTYGRNEAVQGTTSVVSAVNSATTNTTTGATSNFLGTKSSVSRLGLREAWMLFPVPNTPVYVKAGHMLLQLGEGWFYRAMKYGSDAWVAFTDIDKLHLGIVNVKVAEGSTANASDDTDFYVGVASYKLDDATTVGLNITSAHFRPTMVLTNIEAHFAGKIGPATLKAEVDVQDGKNKGGYTPPVGPAEDVKYKGNQVVVQAGVPMDALTINATIARGSGNKSGATTKNDGIATVLDTDPHYTFLYEYKVAGPCGISTGFCNTTALSVGAMFAATKNLSIGADAWLLQATEKVSDKTSAVAGSTTNELGTEIDAKINWKLADNLTWNTNLGYLDPGKGLGKDPATGIQAVLSMKF